MMSHIFFVTRVSSEEHQLPHPPLPSIFYSQCFPYTRFASYCEYRISNFVIFLNKTTSYKILPACQSVSSPLLSSPLLSSPLLSSPPDLSVHSFVVLFGLCFQRISLLLPRAF